MINIDVAIAFICLFAGATIGYIVGEIVGKKKKRKEIRTGLDDLLESGEIKIQTRAKMPSLHEQTMVE